MKKKFPFDKLFIIIFLIGFVSYLILLIAGCIGNISNYKKVIIDNTDEFMVRSYSAILNQNITLLIFNILKLIIIGAGAFLFLFNFPQKHKMTNFVVATSIYSLIFAELISHVVYYISLGTALSILFIFFLSCFTSVYIWYMVKEIRKRKTQKDLPNPTSPN